MSENQKSGPVVTVSATDRDIDENARLSYTLKESDRTYFSVEDIPPNAGVLTVYRVNISYRLNITPVSHCFPSRMNEVFEIYGHFECPNFFPTRFLSSYIIITVLSAVHK